MERVILISCDLVNKDFQIEVSPTFIAKDMKTASHVLTLVTDQAARRGQKVNNVKMKNVKLWNYNDFNE